MGSANAKELKYEIDEKFLIKHNGRINNMFFLDHRNEIVSCSSDKMIKITNLDSLNSYSLQNDYQVDYVAKLKENLLVSCELDCSISLWKLNNNKFVLKKKFLREDNANSFMHKLKIYKIIPWENNGKHFLTCSEDGSVKMWDILFEGENNKIQLENNTKFDAKRMEKIISILRYKDEIKGEEKEFLIVALNSSKEIKIFTIY